jgi:hypothetical protein
MRRTVPHARQNAGVTDLQDAVDQLQAVPLEDFVAERKRLAKELRSAGDREAAAELAKLSKPSAPAWALNHVAREEPAAVADWLEATGALRDASAHADRSSGDALRAAMAAHRDATRQLLATVREQARPNGRPLTEPMLDRVRDLLQAATADEARADALRAGRVVEGDAAAASPDADEETLAKDGAKDGAKVGAKTSRSGRSSKSRSPTDTPATDAAATDADRAAEARAAKERGAREAAERAELERLVADVEARVAELRDAAEERAAAVAGAEERLEDAQRALHRSESELAAAREAAEEAADAAEHAESELRTLTAKLSS